LSGITTRPSDKRRLPVLTNETSGFAKFFKKTEAALLDESLKIIKMGKAVEHVMGCHDTQHNDTWNNDSQHKDNQHHDTQHNDIQHNGTQHDGIQHNHIQHNDAQHNSK